ncbi:segregation and condensation protein A [Streptomyces lateritius]|uniref:Segregation and condensation protein A n=1 Tax=Streptomyces lateritius TaxID=67313 RepID=A0ABW6Y9I1_9ACTN
MPPPPDETSRPPRRRTLGRGPRTTPPGAAPPEPPSAAPGPSRAAEDPAGPAGPARGPLDETPEALDEAAHAPPAVAAPGSGDPERAAASGGLAGEPAGSGTGGSGAPGNAPEGRPGPVPGTGASNAAPPAPAVAGGGSTEGRPVPAEDASVPAANAPAADGPVQGAPVSDDGRFTVRLANFEGPFDLLLQLISRHRLDVTEVALSRVTDEFMAHIRAMGPDWDLDQTTEFLVVAATLLDLKAARLLPAAEVEDEADLALLEARDLLFARLLQYRAYKRIAEIFAERWEAEGRRHPRTVGLESHHAELLPEVVISIGAEGFARLAVKAMQPKAEPQVYVDHIHAPLVSVREQAGLVVALLKERGTVSFRELAEGAHDTLTVVARFLALLELYREKAVALDQEEALGELTVSWTGGDGDEETRVTDEFDQEDQETEAPR